MDSKEMWWRFFVFHADQRLRAFYYYLIIIGALSVAYKYVLSDGELKQYSFMFCLLSIVISIGFFMLEIRNVQLVNTARDYLRVNGMQEIEGTTKALVKSWGIFGCFNKVPLINSKTIKYFCGPIAKHELWLRTIYLVVLTLSATMLFNKVDKLWLWLWFPFIFAYLSVLKCDKCEK